MHLDFLYTNKFLMIAYGFTGNIFDAKDIIQDVALNMLRYDKDKPQEELRKIASIAIRNRYIDLKKGRHKTYELFENYDLPIPSIEKKIMDRERVNEVIEKLNNVNKHNAEVFLLSVNGYNTASLQEIFNEKANTLLSRIFKVRRHIRKTA